jgi:hypothetical protein
LNPAMSRNVTLGTGSGETERRPIRDSSQDATPESQRNRLSLEKDNSRRRSPLKSQLSGELDERTPTGNIKFFISIFLDSQYYILAKGRSGSKILDGLDEGR